MKIHHIAGYKFISLSDLTGWKSTFLDLCQSLKGTILLSEEGININLSGTDENIATFKNALTPPFLSLTFRETITDHMPYKRLKIMIKKEIITFRQSRIHPEKKRAPFIPAEHLKQMLDENRDFTLLDTRNVYEIAYGTFRKATHVNIEDFSEFANAVHQLNPEKPLVMFCTGGIRCEKASLHLMNMGFREVYQLDGGILQYFTKVGGAHYDGACFVFDEREALTPNLQSIHQKD
jgi:UPF0176 protein